MDQNSNMLYIGLGTGFYKVDDNLNIIKNEVFKFSSIDGDYTYDDTKIIATEDGMYGEGGYYQINYETGKEIIPSILRNKIESVHTKNDVLNLQQELPHINSFGSAQFNDDHTVTFYLPLLIKEENIPNGYARNDLVLLSPAFVKYNYDSNNNITSFSISTRSNITTSLIKASNFKKPETITDFTKAQYLYNLDLSGSNNRACINGYDDGKIITDNALCTTSVPVLDASFSYSMVSYFIDQKGTVKLNISYTVNGLTKYNVSNNNNLKYKITVKNTGNAPSGDNVITTIVPQEIIVDESSISHSGIYNKNNNTITWKIDRIEIEEELTVFYKATAPSGLRGKELISNSAVTSQQMSSKVYSNNVIVTFDKIVEIINNPNTGNNLIYIPNTNIGIPVSIIFIIMLLSLMVTITIIKIKKINSNKKL